MLGARRIPPALPPRPVRGVTEAEAKALRSAEAITERLWTTGEGAAPLRERAKRKVTDADVKAANGWWDRFFAHRDWLGMGSVSGVYKTHIQPVLDLPWAVITPADVERLRDAFDAKIADGKASAKTMFNAWAVWTVASKAAAGQWKKDKRRSLKEPTTTRARVLPAPTTTRTTPSNCSGSTRARSSRSPLALTSRSRRAAGSCFRPTFASAAANSRRRPGTRSTSSAV